jgi:hypothetical protein
METEARARGLAGWARGRALGDGVPGCWAAAAKVPGAYTRMTAHSGRVSDPPLRMPAKMMRGGARCAILIGSSAIRNPRIPLKPHAMFFSNRSKRACLRARFAQVSRTTNRQSHFTTRAFLIATRPELEIELTRSQQTRNHFLIATFSRVFRGCGSFLRARDGDQAGSELRPRARVAKECERLCSERRRARSLVEPT